MKKFLVCLVILLVFASVVFFTGWTQVKVKPGEVGAVISKTDGIDSKPVENGLFSWHWQFLLPGNANIKKFNIKPFNVEKTVKGQLPSGEIYTSFINSSGSFSYYFTFDISLTLTPENIVELLKQNKISNNDDLTEYLDNAASVIAQLSSDYLLSKSQEKENFRPESVRREDILKYIKFYKDCPEVDLLTFALIDSKIPDYNLYRKLQNQYLSNTFNQSEDNEAEVSDLSGNS